MKKTMIFLPVIFAMLGHLTCSKEEYPLPRTIGTTIATMNGTPWPDSKNFIVLTRVSDGDTGERLDCHRGKFFFEISLHEKQQGFLRYSIGFGDIPKKLGKYPIQRINFKNGYSSPCEYDFPNSTCGFVEADGDVLVAFYDTKADSDSYVEVTQIDAKKKTIKGKFQIHLVQDEPGNSKFSPEMVFTNGVFEAIIN